MCCKFYRIYYYLKLRVLVPLHFLTHKLELYLFLVYLLGNADFQFVRVILSKF